MNKTIKVITDKLYFWLCDWVLNETTEEKNKENME